MCLRSCQWRSSRPGFFLYSSQYFGSLSIQALTRISPGNTYGLSIRRTFDNSLKVAAAVSATVAWFLSVYRLPHSSQPSDVEQY